MCGAQLQGAQGAPGQCGRCRSGLQGGQESPGLFLAQEVPSFLRLTGHPCLSWNELDSEGGSRPGVDRSLAGGYSFCTQQLPGHTRTLGLLLEPAERPACRDSLNIFQM